MGASDPIAKSEWKISLVVESASPLPFAPRGDPRRAHHFEHGAELRKEFRRDFGLPPSTDPWPELPLNEKTAKRLIAWAEHRKENARYARGYVTETPAVKDAEWFILRPHRDDQPIDRDDENVECVGRHWSRFSDRFVRRVADLGLTGIRFVPEREAPRFRHRRDWFDAYPTSAIGRGADHPWVDRKKFEKHKYGEIREAKWLHGISHFYNDTLRDDPPGMSQAFRQLTGTSRRVSSRSMGRPAFRTVISPQAILRCC